MAYDSKYLFQTTVMYDGSQVNLKTHRWGLFSEFFQQDGEFLRKVLIKYKVEMDR